MQELLSRKAKDKKFEINPIKCYARFLLYKITCSIVLGKIIEKKLVFLSFLVIK